MLARVSVAEPANRAVIVVLDCASDGTRELFALNEYDLAKTCTSKRMLPIDVQLPSLVECGIQEVGKGARIQ